MVPVIMVDGTESDTNVMSPMMGRLRTRTRSNACCLNNLSNNLEARQPWEDIKGVRGRGSIKSSGWPNLAIRWKVVPAPVRVQSVRRRLREDGCIYNHKPRGSFHLTS
jgi:hypothetical protein